MLRLLPVFWFSRANGLSSTCTAAHLRPASRTLNLPCRELLLGPAPLGLPNPHRHTIASCPHNHNAQPTNFSDAGSRESENCRHPKHGHQGHYGMTGRAVTVLRRICRRSAQRNLRGPRVCLLCGRGRGVMRALLYCSSPGWAQMWKTVGGIVGADAAPAHQMWGKLLVCFVALTVGSICTYLNSGSGFRVRRLQNLITNYTHTYTYTSATKWCHHALCCTMCTYTLHLSLLSILSSRTRAAQALRRARPLPACAGGHGHTPQHATCCREPKASDRRTPGARQHVAPPALNTTTTHAPHRHDIDTARRTCTESPPSALARPASAPPRRGVGEAT